VEQLKIVKEVLQVDWCAVIEITDGFLWLDSACGASGEELPFLLILGEELHLIV
jgi:hypothetical protein